MDVAPADNGVTRDVDTEIVVRVMSHSLAADQGESEVRDVFWAVWPILEASLKRPRGDREIAEELGVHLGQARAWLDRAVEEGLASLERRRRKLYMASGVNGDQLSLVVRSGE